MHNHIKSVYIYTGNNESLIQLRSPPASGAKDKEVLCVTAQVAADL